MIPAALDTPWKLWNEVGRWLGLPWNWWLFRRNGIPWGKGWRLYGAPIVLKHRHSRMEFGEGLQLRSNRRSNPLAPNHPVVLCTWQAGAELRVGAHFAMTGGVICAARQIVIGDWVTVGANTTIVDTDFHPLQPEHRRLQPQEAAVAPVVIEDEAFIGMNCLILKGVRLGRGCVIGAGSVVTRDVPPGAVAAGNPAQVIRTVGG